LLSGKHQGLGAVVVRSQSGVILEAEQLDIRSGESPNPIEIGPCADDLEFQVRTATERVNNQVGAFVRDHPAGHEIVILTGSGRRIVKIDVDRGMDDCRRAAIALLDPTRDKLAVGNEVVDGRSPANIPDTKLMEDSPREEPPRAKAESRSVEVL